MLLIADSGSTKSEWTLCANGKVLYSFTTTGFNADVMPEEAVRTLLHSELRVAALPAAPEKIMIYAASMGNPRNRELVARILNELWPAAQVEVEHDLLAAARAGCQHEPGIACILGTGSNSCLYDGHRIVQEIGGQGYLFGDEGSGAHIGRELLRRLLNGYLPPDLVQAVADWKGLPPLEMRKEALQSAKANVLLAGYSKFVSAHSERKEMEALVKHCFGEFLRETVMRYENHAALPVHFTGSVGFTYRNWLVETCEQAGLRPGRILKSPSEALIQYHLT